MAGSFIWLLIAVLGAFSTRVERPRGRILGGREAPRRPYMASLQINRKHICGGFLIAEQWVLSAAHCLEDAGNETFQVLLGTRSLSGFEPNKRLFGVRRLVPHPGSSRYTNHDDLLLVQLEERAFLNSDVQILAFQREDRDLPEGTRCEVAGWGIISNTGKRPENLHHVELGVIGRPKCNERIHHDGEVTEKMMCAESRKKDSCKGDSGGPLVCNDIAEAIVTTGSRICGNWKKPGIYTRTAPYTEWISSVLASSNN
ncbi:complement factor D-like isoform X2 [Rhineura floridana]|nr:complement factor D-like isoform X2 [Rhineura floridana]XP_061458223.1 complement factor D-like isoform X2 [Rhineura floridana]